MSTRTKPKNHGQLRPFLFIGGPADGQVLNTYGGQRFDYVTRAAAEAFGRDPLDNPSPPRTTYVRDGDRYCAVTAPDE